MNGHFTTISPVDGRIYLQRPWATDAEIRATLDSAVSAQANWRQVAVPERAEFCLKAVDALLALKSKLGEEISWQMGRPIRYTGSEVEGFAERARYMVGIAAQKLADVQVQPRPGLTRFIRRQPLGVVFSIVPWNYPYLTAVNSIIPALMSGNTVVMKPSVQTPLTAERIARAFTDAGLPDGVFQYLYLDHQNTGRVIKAPAIAAVSFTGSVPGGEAVERAALGRFINVGLELGGKDPAYVRPDVELAQAIENLVDGAFFNSGQSCCAVERIYVHADIYRRFVDGFVDQVRTYKLGNPLEPETTLGPMVCLQAAALVRQQITGAVEQGSKACIDPREFPADEEGTPYLAPQVLVDVTHSMAVMRHESFGPVVGIMEVTSDRQAVELMNDSEFGLTASVWTTDEKAALELGEQVQTGTWYMNRCDHLDPALAWTGVKHSGRGCTLSEVGYEYLTRPKSFYLRTGC